MMLDARRSVGSFPTLMMITLKFTAWHAVDWALLRVPFTEFTAMVNSGDILPSKRVHPVTRGAKRKQKPKPVEGASVRATISFPSELYKTLDDIAREKKVSLAWVVREAAEQYIAEKWPLFGKSLIHGEK